MVSPRPAVSTPPRQLVVCCDGTSNTISGGARDTNVLRVTKMLAAQGADRDEAQVLYYDPGVGAPDGVPPTGLVAGILSATRTQAGLAVGSGIYENVGQAYLFLCREYGRLATEAARAAGTVDDEIYLFGFSRGAFTVRSVAGMVNLFGLVRPDHEPLLPTLLRVYFSPVVAPRRVQAAHRAGQRLLGAKDATTRADAARDIRATFTDPIGRDALVHFVGVWDTVQSVGIPGLRREITSDTGVKGKAMLHVRHALSLDEHRRQFWPRFFDGALGTEADAVRRDDLGDAHARRYPVAQTLRQLWFRGVHADIGGGGPPGTSRLSDATYAWMAAEAQHCGLRNVSIKPVPEAGYPDPEFLGDQLRKVPWWALTGMVLRDPAGAPAGNVTIEPIGGVPEATPPTAVEREAAPGTLVVPPADQSAAEHWSVAGFSPPAEGGPSGPRGPIRSPWQRRWSASRGAVVALAVLWALVWTVAAGSLASASADFAVGDGSSWVDGLTAGAALEVDEVEAIQAIGFGGTTTLEHQATALWSDAPGADPAARLGDQDVGAALAAQLLGLIGWMYVLAVIASTAYSGRRTRWRRVGQALPVLERGPTWLRGFKTLYRSPLGNALPFVLLGGVLSFAAFGLARVAGWDLLITALLFAGAVLWCLKALGVAMVVALVVIGPVASGAPRFFSRLAGRPSAP